MSNRVCAVLLLCSVFWINPAAAQVGAQKSPGWFLAVNAGQLTANINRIPLHLVLEELARQVPLRARQVPLRLALNEGWRDHLVTAHFRALPLEEALRQLLAGLSYAIVYAPAAAGKGSAAERRIVELLVLEKAPAARFASSSKSSITTSNTGTGQGQHTTLDTTPEWTAVLQHTDKAVRLEALQRWAEQGAATPLNPLTQALVDPDESVRAQAQELVERVWAAMAQAGAR